MELDSSVLYYLASRPFKETEWSDEEKVVEKKKRKKKSKSKKKKFDFDAKDEETEPLLKLFNSEQMTQCSLPEFDHFRPTEPTEDKKEPIKLSPRRMIRIYIQCEPVAQFELSVDPTRKVEDIMADIAEHVWQKYNTRINVRGLEYTGEGSVHKDIPIDYPIGELLNDQEEVIVEFTTPVQAAQTMSYENTRVSDDEEQDTEEEDDKDAGKGTEVFVCPFTFSGPTANRDLKIHLANVSQIPTHLPKSDHGETIRCPLYFFNEEDSHVHIQDSVRAIQERENPDLRTFWERNEEETAKVSSILIKRELEKTKRMELDKIKKKEKKRGN